MRILVVSHGHPDFSKGGAEIASYSLYKGYEQSSRVDSVFYLARYGGNNLRYGAIRNYKGNEYLWSQRLIDIFHLKGESVYSLLYMFLPFLKAVNPDIIHIHHYMHIGLEIIRIIKNYNPNIRILMTLHEYIAICSNNGLMIKKDGALCYESGVLACSQCMREFSQEDFWLRKHKLMYFFSLIDIFIAPSRFLKDRYVDWGIPEEKLVVIENGLRKINNYKSSDIKNRNRFGYFGQINKYKGIDMLLESFLLIDKNILKDMRIEIHGSGLEFQEESFREKIQSLYKELEDICYIKFYGRYEESELEHLMKNVDWVLMPSIWWENSPVVIQEALTVGRPILVSNIGGMAEKVNDQVNGIHIQARSPQAWAEAISICCGNDDLYSSLTRKIYKPFSLKDATKAHIKLIDKMMEGIC